VAEAETTRDGHALAFEAYGVKAVLSANRPELVERLRPLLPPGAKPCLPSEAERRFALIAEPRGTYGFAVNDDPPMNRGLELELALMLLDSQVRLYLGVKSPDTIFIHAGVVGHRGAAIVVPGRSFAGKTMLVTALVRAGATYYSDEFAVLDEQGLVHPYAKPLSLRGDDLMQTDHPVESLGWTAGSEPLRLGAIVITSYRADAEWRPRRVTGGEGAMALLANAVPAKERPAQVMRVISRAAEGAIAIESDRGEADAIAPLLLAELEASASAGDRPVESG
jgi:hypothetical protein